MNSQYPLYGVVHIETDCLQVVQELNSKRRNDTEFDSIIDECRKLKLLALNLNCKRSCPKTSKSSGS
jgi:hypothetical protein